MKKVKILKGCSELDLCEKINKALKKGYNINLKLTISNDKDFFIIAYK